MVLPPAAPAGAPALSNVSVGSSSSPAGGTSPASPRPAARRPLLDIPPEFANAAHHPATLAAPKELTDAYVDWLRNEIRERQTSITQLRRSVAERKARTAELHERKITSVQGVRRDADAGAASGGDEETG